jgi:hypothetical protein
VLPHAESNPERQLTRIKAAVDFVTAISIAHGSA